MKMKKILQFKFEIELDSPDTNWIELHLRYGQIYVDSEIFRHENLSGEQIEEKIEKTNRF